MWSADPKNEEKSTHHHTEKTKVTRARLILPPDSLTHCLLNLWCKKMLKQTEKQQLQKIQTRKVFFKQKHKWSTTVPLLLLLLLNIHPNYGLPTERQQQIHHAQRIKTITSLYTDRVTGESEEVSLSI